MAIKPILSYDQVFHPVPWEVYPNVPIFDDDGNPIFYARLPSAESNVRHSLPTEFFHHQLEALNITDAGRVSEFMSEYGELYSEDYPFNKVSLVFACELCKSPWLQTPIPEDFTNDDINAAFNDILPHLRKAMADQYAPVAEPYLQEYLSKYPIVPAHSYAENPPMPFGLDDDFPDWIPCVLHQSVTDTYMELLSAAISVDALACPTVSATEREIELVNKIGHRVSPNSERTNIEIIEYGLMMLNRFTRNMPVSIGYFDTETGETSFPRMCSVDGSLTLAIGLQMLEFVYYCNHDGYYRCSRCGRVFAKKQSKSKRSRKPSPNATSVFCCDECKNAEQQKRHRQTPAYKNKYKQGKK